MSGSGRNPNDPIVILFGSPVIGGSNYPARTLAMPSESHSLTVATPVCSTSAIPPEPPQGGPPVRSLYIHVPFCFHKCHYCDFYSFVDTQDRQEPYARALALELARWGRLVRQHKTPDDPRPTPEHKSASLRTVFIGGGTPSLLRPELWRRLLDDLHAAFNLDHDCEFTVECNPETVNPELMRILKQGGVTRVSIGGQSFNPAHLKTLERWHDPANVEKALRLADDAGIERRSIDLIFGVPGQTISDWRDDLERALALRPVIEHISCYALTYEPNTAMTKRVALGQITPIDDAIESEMFRLTLDLLRDRGFERYEVSNFARDAAAECRHNLAYWRQEPWLAAGPSASGHLAGFRWKNVPRLTEWMQGVTASDGASPVIDLETPDPRRALREKIMTGLRLSEGLDADDITTSAARFGMDRRLLTVASRYRARGMLRDADARWSLTDAGFFYADAIAAEFMSALTD